MNDTSAIDELFDSMNTDDAPHALQSAFLPICDLKRMWGVTQTSVETIINNPRRMAVDILRIFIANRTPITLWGPIGARKTRTIESMSVELDANGVHYQVITMIPSTQDASILHGIMYTVIEDGIMVMKRSVPNVAKEIMDYWNISGGYTILFLDELTTSMASQQNAMLGLLTHAKFEGIDISPYITIVMAANPEGTVSTVNDVSEAVINRGGHIAWYGDVNLFIEDWDSGFGRESLVPDRKVSWFVRELLNQAPDEAFRNKHNWTEDSLVPYDRMEHTERAMTELARMISLINEIMADLPAPIRHVYIVEVSRALLGNTWAERAALVLAMESEFLSPDLVISRLGTMTDITVETTADDFDALMLASGYPLYRLPDGAAIRQDQAVVILGELIERITKHGFNKEAYIASWAFAVAAPTTGQVMGNHAHMLILLDLAQRSVQGGVLDAKSAVPKFVSQSIRDGLRAAASNA